MYCVCVMYLLDTGVGSVGTVDSLLAPGPPPVLAVTETVYSREGSRPPMTTLLWSAGTVTLPGPCLLRSLIVSVMA